MIKFLISVILCLTVSPVWAVDFDAQRREEQEATTFVRNIVGGDEYEKILLGRYPNSKFSWGANKILLTGDKSLTYLVYCEIKPPKEEPSYYFYEVKISAVNESPELMKKYEIGSE